MSLRKKDVVEVDESPLDTPQYGLDDASTPNG